MKIEKIDYEISGKEIQKSLETLAKLWKKGTLPNELKEHHLLTVSSLNNWNLRKTSKSLGTHRNVIQKHIADYFGKRKSIKFRKAWNLIQKSKKRKSFPEQVFILYKENVGTPLLSSSENKSLVNFWMCCLNFKVLKAHYVFWALREGHKLESISRSLRRHIRSTRRIVKDIFWSKKIYLKKIKFRNLKDDFVLREFLRE